MSRVGTEDREGGWRRTDYYDVALFGGVGHTGEDRSARKECSEGSQADLETEEGL